MIRFCSWCKKAVPKATAIDVVEGDQVAHAVYACPECVVEYRLVPLRGHALSPRAHR